MATTKQPIVYFTTHTAAKRLGAEEWEVRNLFANGLLPEPPRLGSRRIILESELPAIREALERWRATKRKGNRRAVRAD